MLDKPPAVAELAGRAPPRRRRAMDVNELAEALGRRGLASAPRHRHQLQPQLVIDASVERGVENLARLARALSMIAQYGDPTVLAACE